MVIEFYIKTVYGKKHMYIKDTALAAAIQTLTGRKVLTEDNKQALEILGFTFKEVSAV